MYRVYFDGGGYRNLFCIVDPNKPKIIIEKYPTHKNLDSTTYEYLALSYTLKYIKNFVKENEIEILGDCSSVIQYANCSNGSAWFIGRQTDYKIRNYCHDLINQLNQIKKLYFRWIPRKENTAGHLLAQIRHFDKVDQSFSIHQEKVRYKPNLRTWAHGGI